MEESSLIRLAQAGDREAFHCLFEAYREKIFGLAFNYLKNLEDAEDVLQETFVRAYRHLGRFNRDESASLSGWITRIGVNCCMDSFRKRKMRTRSAEGMSAVEGAADPGRDADPEYYRELQEVRERLDAIVEEFPARQRMAFSLRHHQDFKVREIAAALGCSEGAVKTMLFRSFEAIKKRLKKFLGEKTYEML